MTAVSPPVVSASLLKASTDAVAVSNDKNEIMMKAQQQLRTSIHQAVAEFRNNKGSNSDSSGDSLLKPSNLTPALVGHHHHHHNNNSIKMNRNPTTDSSSSRTVVTTTAASTPNSSNNNNETATTNDDNVHQNVDLKAVQALLAALSFSQTAAFKEENASSSSTPTTSTSTGTSITSTTTTGGSSLTDTSKAWVFESPEVIKSSSNNRQQQQQTSSSSSSELFTTPAWIKRRVVTPPTKVSADDNDYDGEDDDDDEEPCAGVVTPSPEKHSMGEPKKCTTTATSNGGDIFRTTNGAFRSSWSSSDAASLAYPLSLPMTHQGLQSRSLSYDMSAASNSSSSNQQQQGRNNSHGNNNKPVKKYPTVSTDIPGAGVLRSSVSSKAKGSCKNHFVPIVAGGNHHAVDLRRNRHSNNNNNNVAQQVYHHAKGAWSWGKGVMVVSPLMGLTEGVVSVAAGLTTGNGNLNDLEQNLLAPLVVALDDHVLNPVVAGLCHFLGGIFILGGGGKRGRNDDTATTTAAAATK